MKCADPRVKILDGRAKRSRAKFRSLCADPYREKRPPRTKTAVLSLCSLSLADTHPRTIRAPAHRHSAKPLQRHHAQTRASALGRGR
jgi:hypothetical protein